ncbi:MAG TPA: M1 family metallopeptidase [Polyangia bacterium]
MSKRDPHSYNDDAQPEVEEVAWRARVDFLARVLEGEVVLTLRAPTSSAQPIDLDTRDLAILSVSGDSGGRLPFSVGAPEPILGSRLRIELPAQARTVRITYRTSPEASALQWLSPAQTAGGRHPFLFSQCQAIHARSLLPIQDTPRLRIRYHAELTVPRALRGLMAAAFRGREEKGELAVEKWEMPQPIPPYLIALAVGELASRELGPRSAVWAEPEVVERAAWEFAGVDQMVRAAEALFGPYDWERFDILTMPPSFPYGGMENPRLTFLTPTLLAGDRSLVSVVAHELAHSWTGNLVSNASAEHFWLNEGFTVFAERRIVEVIDGPEVCALQAALGRRELDRALGRFAAQPELTRLHTHLAGIDPDEAFSEIPYEKGFLFLRAIEEAAGRPAFDRFLRGYVERFRFRAITTDDFCALAEELLPGVLARIDAPAWLDKPGLPPGAPESRSTRLDAIRALGPTLPSEEIGRAFSPVEWQLYLEQLPHPPGGELPAGLLAGLEARFHLTGSSNFEILVDWLELATLGNFAPALPRVEEVLGQVGRMKYLRPLYQALCARSETRPLARRCFEKYQAGYHPIARQVVEALLRG